jgi:hypothetical protein
MKRLFPILAAGIMACLSIMAGIGAVPAQERAEARYYGAVTPRRIAMGVGKSVIIDLPQDAAEIFVANPKVANAVVRSPRKLYVIGIGRQAFLPWISKATRSPPWSSASAAMLASFSRSCAPQCRRRRSPRGRSTIRLS